MRKILKELVYRLRGEYTTEKLISMRMVVGKNFKRLNGVILDPSHCWLIEIGDNVTMAPRVHILCHDASTKTLCAGWDSGCRKSGRSSLLIRTVSSERKSSNGEISLLRRRIYSASGCFDGIAAEAERLGILTDGQ